MAVEKGRGEVMSSTELERRSDRDYVVTRRFRAPARIVFDAWTKPELVRRWWAPASMGVTVVSIDADVRPGGAYRYVLQPPGGGETIAFSGEYREIVRPTKLVYTSRFEPFPDAAVVTATFDERGDETVLVVHEQYPSKEALDAAISSGMEGGIRVTYDQLDALVVSLPR